MLDVNAACQTCHKASEEQLRERVETIQGRHLELRDLATDAVVQLLDAIATAQATAPPDDRRLTAAREFQRRAQFLLDFAEAENSAGFHAPQEAARVLAMSIDLARRGLVALWAPEG
jgi:nitrite reductase (cytochrome c-552)